MSNNVIDFQAVRDEKIYEQMMDRIEENFNKIFDQAMEIDQVSFFTVGTIVEDLREHGYDVQDNPESIKDIMLMIYAMKGLMYRCKGEKAAYHSLADQAYVNIEDPQTALDKFLDLYYYEPPIE